MTAPLSSRPRLVACLAALVCGCIATALLAGAPSRASAAVPSADTLTVQEAHTELTTLMAGAQLDRPKRAAELYRRILRAAGAGEHSALVRRHVAQLAPILPDPLVDAITRAGSVNRPEQWRLSPDAGTRLLRWWRRHDSLPATGTNERMEQHLQRVAHARHHFRTPNRLAQYDDRGEIYVRFGPPKQRDSIQWNVAEFLKKVFRFGVPVSKSSFPDNEIWTYHHIAPTGYYIFVKKNHGYRISESTDLLPPRLRYGLGGRQSRDQNIAYSSMAAMEYIYRKLSYYQSHFGPRYTDIANYNDWQENQSKAKSLGADNRSKGMTVGAGVGSNQVTVFENRKTGKIFPSAKAKNIIVQSKSEDREVARARAREMPPSRTSALNNRATLPVEYRTARFLAEDGSTQTEFYWSLDEHADVPAGSTAAENRADGETSQRLVSFSAVQYDADYARQAQQKSQHVYAPLSGAFPAQTGSLRDAAGRYHVALQWDAYLARVPEGERRRQPALATKVVRLDSLQALSATASRLVMSDLKPLYVGEAAAERGRGLLEAAAPYPYETIDTDATLLLYFETYHLQFGKDDRTRYSVAYEVTRETDRRGLGRLFLGKMKSETTTTQSTYQGNGRTAEDRILIDLSQWEDEQPNRIKITVRVTDEVTGQEQARTISFDVRNQD
jgi:GWxTD domain-containing protein